MRLRSCKIGRNDPCGWSTPKYRRPSSSGHPRSLFISSIPVEYTGGLGLFDGGYAYASAAVSVRGHVHHRVVQRKSDTNVTGASVSGRATGSSPRARIPSATRSLGCPVTPTSTLRSCLRRRKKQGVPVRRILTRL